VYCNLKYIEVKIKKPHTCWGCNVTCVPGFKMKYSVGVFDGDFSTSYWCEICDSFLTTGHFNDDGVAYGEFKGEAEYEYFKKKYLIQERKVMFEKYDKWKAIKDAVKIIEQNGRK